MHEDAEVRYAHRVRPPRILVPLAVTLSVFLLLTTASALASPQEVMRVIIGFTGGVDVRAIEELGGKVVKRLDALQAVVAEISSLVAYVLMQSRNVAFIDNNIEFHASIDISYQILPWGIDRVNSERIWGGADTAVHTLEGLSGGEGISVAVIDTGIDYTHPDLAPAYAGGHDFVNGDTSPLDDNGHGTHVAGTIAAIDNSVGVIGAAPLVRIYALKVLGQSGVGSLDAVVSALNWAIDPNGDGNTSDHIQVISMSLGSSTGAYSLQLAVDRAYSAGALLVAAAGNHPPGPNSIGYPAAYPSVIAVTAVNSDNVVASFSNYGPEAELAAPGVQILSTTPTYSNFYLRSYGVSTNYDYLSGTSMATPHVSGVAALLMSAYPALTNYQVRALLDNSAIDLGAAGRDYYYGYGLVDASRAFTSLAAFLKPPLDLTPFPTPFVSQGTLDATFVVGLSSPHPPATAAHTIDVVGGVDVAAALARNASSGVPRSLLDVYAARYEPTSGIQVTAPGNLISLGGPGVNFVTSYFNSRSPVLLDVDANGAFLQARQAFGGSGLLFRGVNDYFRGLPVTDYGYVSLLFDNSSARYVLLVAGLSGFSTRATAQLLAWSQLRLAGTGLLVQFVDANGDGRPEEYSVVDGTGGAVITSSTAFPSDPQSSLKIVVAASNEHPPVATANTIDVVGSIMLAEHLALGSGFTVLGVLDFDAAHSPDGVGIVIDVTGDLLSVGGMDVNYVSRYYNSSLPVQMRVNASGPYIYVPSTGAMYRMTNDYYQGLSVTDYAFTSAIRDSAGRRVRVVEGISGFAGQEMSGLLSLDLIPYQSTGLVVEFVDLDGDPSNGYDSYTVVQSLT